MERLDKVIGSQTEYSRSDIKKLCKNGLIKVNEKIILKSDYKVNTDTDKIYINDELLEYKKYVYLVLNKPRGYVSATTDGNFPTVIDLVPCEYTNRNIFPVGRLDKDTIGLMILSDDGDFAHDILSPKKHVSKKYYVEVDKDLNTDMIEEFRKGIKLNDGDTKSSILEILGDKSCYVTLTEGRYHQIKRMFGCFGMEVTLLKRISMGGFKLPNDLDEGECRELTEDEFKSIKE